ncbi:MAG: shikimate dehydrogenase [Hyphomicrobiales bacterium]|nr:shikimate dehydrogenase [Hyphomicrobiales bacterium]
MKLDLTGATRLNVIVGDPIAQVRSPGGVTQAFNARGYDGVLVPVQVAPEDLTLFLDAATKLRNLDGIIVTVPHKFACYEYCASATERANFIGSANIMRRRPDGGWHGEITDGLGFVGAAMSHGVDPRGKRALQIGAGGAGSAIALALIEAGVAELALHDANEERRDALISRLARRGKGRVVVGSPDPTGYDMVCNATPAGMTAGDPTPVDVSKISPAAYCGCVITKPAVSPFIAAARAKGCVTGTGAEMYESLQGKMVDFLLFADGEA